MTKKDKTNNDYNEIIRNECNRRAYDPFMCYKDMVYSLMKKENISYEEAKTIIEQREFIKFN